MDITKQIRAEIKRLQKVLALLDGGKAVRHRRKKLSPAARKRIGDAQRARWAAAKK
jgi:hypothetical protein